MKTLHLPACALLALASTSAHAVGIGQVLGLPFDLGSPQSAVEKAGFKCMPPDQHSEYSAIPPDIQAGRNLRALFAAKYMAICDKQIAIPGVAQPQTASVYTSPIDGKVVKISSRLPQVRPAFDVMQARVESMGDKVTISTTVPEYYTEPNSCVKYHEFIKGYTGRISIWFTKWEGNNCNVPGINGIHIESGIMGSTGDN